MSPGLESIGIALTDSHRGFLDMFEAAPTDFAPDSCESLLVEIVAEVGQLSTFGSYLGTGLGPCLLEVRIGDDPILEDFRR